MLFPFSEIKAATIEGNDGTVGSVRDVYFDATHWGVRYLVVDTGAWLPGRQVLLPTPVLEPFDLEHRRASTTLNREQVKQSPDVSTEQPISRQMESELMKHYHVPYYWGPAGGALAGGGPPSVPLGTSIAVDSQQKTESELPNLRSAREVINYYIAAADGDLGHVEDLVIDDSCWAIRYFVVDTRNWLPGKKVLIAISWIEEISWSDNTVSVDLKQEMIKQAPEFDPSARFERDAEEKLHNHYGLNGYWMM